MTTVSVFLYVTIAQLCEYIFLITVSGPSQGAAQGGLLWCGGEGPDAAAAVRGGGIVGRIDLTFKSNCFSSFFNPQPDISLSCKILTHVEEIDGIKTEMEERGSSMTDGAPVVRIKLT